MAAKYDKPDIVGKRFGSLVVLNYIAGRIFLCVCDCGRKTQVSGSRLLRGKVLSCGCGNQKRGRPPNIVKKLAAIMKCRVCGQIVEADIIEMI